MKEKNKVQLKAALDQLPGYKADNSVWEKIEQELDKADPSPARIRPLFEMRWQAMAAAVLLLIATSVALLFWLRSNPQQDVPVVQAEKLITDEVELTEAEVAAFETQMEEEEEALKNCLNALSEARSQEYQKAILTLEKITVTRDSLSLLLGTALERPGADRRLSRLERKRRQMIRELREQVCN